MATEAAVVVGVVADGGMGQADAGLVRAFTPDGELSWETPTRNGLLGHRLALDASGNILWSGIKSPEGDERTYQTHMMGLATDGSKVWEREVLFEGAVGLPGIVNFDPHPSEPLVGIATSEDIRLEGLGANGSSVWTTTIDGVCGQPFDVAVSASGDLFAVGGAEWECQESWVARLDPAGKVIWRASHPAPFTGSSIAISVIALDDGCIVAGTDLEREGDWTQQGWIERRDSSGALEWTRVVAEDEPAPIWVRELDADDTGVVVGGTLSHPSEISDVIVERYTLTGERDWSLVVGDDGSSEALGGMSVASHGVYLTMWIDGQSWLFGLR